MVLTLPAGSLPILPAPLFLWVVFFSTDAKADLNYMPESISNKYSISNIPYPHILFGYPTEGSRKAS